MNKIRAAQASDLHYCEKTLAWVDKAFGCFVDGAIETKADVAIISGDSFDHQVHVHDPAVHAFLRQISRLADHMPVLVLQGTFSHDRPGSLEVLRTLAAKHPIYVADAIKQVALIGGKWFESKGYRFEPSEYFNAGMALIVSCLPSVHKGTWKATSEGFSVAESVEQVCAGWGETNLQVRAAGIPTILVTHGTVNGSVTESHYAMISPDHEFSPGVLFSAQASATMVGHIHAHNNWELEGRWIAYPGSITRLVHGHNAPTYWLNWTVLPEGSVFECVETPSRELMSIEFPGPPDMDKLRETAPLCKDAYVRVRWNVDEEHRHNVNADEIREVLKEAAEVKLEGRTNPVQRTRAEGMTRKEGLADKLTIWGQCTATDVSELQSRLTDLQINDADTLIEQYATTETAHEPA